MEDLNCVNLTGRLTADVDLKYTASGMAIANLNIAVNKRKKIGDEWKEVGHFFGATIFGKTAENLAQYLTKGQQVLISGELEMDQWEGSDGKKQTKTKILVNQIRLMGGKPGGSSGSGSGQPEKQTPQASNRPPLQKDQPELGDGDCPF